MSAHGGAALARIDAVDEDVTEQPNASEQWAQLCERLGVEECARCGGHGGGEERDPDGRKIGVWIECDSCCGSGRTPCWPRAPHTPSPALDGPMEIPF